MKVTDAAALLGMDPQTLRYALQQGRFPFGIAIDPDESGRRRWSYYINERRLKNYLGEERGA